MSLEQYQSETIAQQCIETNQTSKHFRWPRQPRQSNSLQGLLASIERDIGDLNQSIAGIEHVTGVTDRDDVKYSMGARSMISRRDNLIATKAALLSRLHPPTDEQTSSQLIAHASV